MTQASRTIRYTGVALLALVVNGLAMVSSNPNVRNALFFDCAITVPLCYWLLLVRSGLRGKSSLVLVSVVSLMRGAYLLNSKIGMAIGVLAEALMAVFVVTRAKRLEDILPSKTLARIARAELDVFRYAFGPAKPPVMADDALAFTLHLSSGAASLFWLLALMTPIEAGLVHSLLPAKFAWTFTALSLYGAVWMIAVARSFAALPIVVDAEGITLRKGMMASLYVPREAIASVSRKEESGGYARFALLADPTVWVTFHRPLLVELPMGFTRQVRGAAIAPDDLNGFVNALGRASES